MLELASEEVGASPTELDRLAAGIAALGETVVLRAFQLTNEAFIHSGPRQVRRLAAVSDRVPAHRAAEPARPGSRRPERSWTRCGSRRVAARPRPISRWSSSPASTTGSLASRRASRHGAGSLCACCPCSRRSDSPTRSRAPSWSASETASMATHSLSVSSSAPAERQTGSARTERTMRLTREDPEMPERNRVLLHCPFCFSARPADGLRPAALVTAAQVRQRRPAPGRTRALPFYVVDEEIYRFLPAVVIGTLDKAALLGMQAAARGSGRLATRSVRRRGPRLHVRAPDRRLRPAASFPTVRSNASPWTSLERRSRPACTSRTSCTSSATAWARSTPTTRPCSTISIQRVDGAPAPKIVASSATLAGYEQQTEQLYARRGSAFPQPGPAEGVSFWTATRRT